MNLIKVASDSKTSAVAGAIANAVREDDKAEVQAIGAGAVNRAIKATIMASKFLSEEEKYVVFVPSFVMVAIGDKERTAIRLSIAPK